ncbi:MAG: patatin-like phospholipase family protein [Actinobacteria bacterium]|nr:patatin-like phospholipase family protein [Actinomycetota bacterium]
MPAMSQAMSINLRDSLPGPIAYVLGGGGSYGASQAGQLRALARTDLRPDFVVGTSVGSLNGTILAESPETAGDRLSAFWSLVDRDMIFGSPRTMMVNLAALRPALADPKPLRSLIERSTDSREFSDLQLPLTAVAADVNTGHHVELNSGDLVSALMASAAIPGIFPSVIREGRKLIDGGVLANVPIGIAAEQGAQTIVVLDCGFNLFAPRTDPTLPHALLRATAMMAAAQVRRDLALYTDRTILYVPAKWPAASRPYDFSKSQVNNSESYSLALAWLARLEVDGAGLYGSPPDVTRANVVS